eukprot:g2048.t1
MLPTATLVPSRSFSFSWRKNLPTHRYGGRGEDAPITLRGCPETIERPLRVVTSPLKDQRGSWKKINHLCRMIRNLPATEALANLEFSDKKKFGPMVRKCVQNACNLADIRYGLREEDLMIERAIVGRGSYIKKIRYHGKGRTGRGRTPRAHIRVTVREMTNEEKLHRYKPLLRESLNIESRENAKSSGPVALLEGAMDVDNFDSEEGKNDAESHEGEQQQDGLSLQDRVEQFRQERYWTKKKNQRHSKVMNKKFTRADQ